MLLTFGLQVLLRMLAYFDHFMFGGGGGGGGMGVF